MATKKSKELLVRCNGTMTESQYLSWIRSALRSKSLQWPPRSQALLLARRPYKGPHKLQRWEYQCSICKQWHKMKDVIVDHHPVAAGRILSIEDIGQFANNLYCETDNLRILCKTDHDIWTLADAQKLSWEEATVLKNVIAFEKSHNIKQIVDYCQKHGYNSCTNSDKRRKALTDIFNEQYKEK